MLVLAVLPRCGWTSCSHTSRTVSTTPKGLSTVRRDVGEWLPFGTKCTLHSNCWVYWLAFSCCPLALGLKDSEQFYLIIINLTVICTEGIIIFTPLLLHILFSWKTFLNNNGLIFVGICAKQKHFLNVEYKVWARTSLAYCNFQIMCVKTPF